MSIPKVAIGDVVEINPKGPKSGELLNDAIVDFVPMASVSEDGTMLVSKRRPYEEVAKGFTPFRDGDILIAKITPCYENNKITKAIVLSDYAFGSTEFHVLRADPKILDPDYLTYYLRQDVIRLAGERRMTGSAGQRRVPKKFLEELEIPLPPLEEQKRIAGILDQADALRRLRTRALDNLNTLGQAIFHEMFGDLKANTLGWPQDQSLGEVADVISGITKGRKTRSSALREVPYLAVSNVQDRFLKLDVVKTIDASEEEIERFCLRKGDILLTEGGDPDKLGRGTIWNNELPECIHQNHIFRVRVGSDRVCPTFLSWQLGSPAGKAYFVKLAKQTTGIASINKTQLKGFPVLFPPIQLQMEFETRLANLSKQAQQFQTSQNHIDTLFASLQHRAFRGDL